MNHFLSYYLGRHTTLRDGSAGIEEKILACPSQFYVINFKLRVKVGGISSVKIHSREMTKPAERETSKGGRYGREKERQIC